MPATENVGNAESAENKRHEQENSAPTLNLAERTAKLLIRFYQLFISPLLGPRCRYYPSCSQYALQAIDVHGLWRGSFLSIKRIARCHPGCEGGIDEVPDAKHPLT